MTSESRSLSTQLEERNIKPAEWHTLAKNLYPGAQPASVLMVIDYCKARKLDPLKKPCHIVNMKVGDGYRDVVLPGIYELRTTAQRTGQYLGHSIPEYGPIVDQAGVKAPEWCAMTVYRWNAASKSRTEFPVIVYFSEVVATKKGGTANSRWTKAPRQMLTKCTEAAALREAFPDEIGGEMSAEEMDGYHEEAETSPRTTTLSDIAGRRTIDSEAEEVESGPETPDEGVKGNGAPPPDDRVFSAEEVEAAIKKAGSRDALEEAMDLIREVPPEERKDLRQLAVDRYQEFV